MLTSYLYSTAKYLSLYKKKQPISDFNYIWMTDKVTFKIVYIVLRYLLFVDFRWPVMARICLIKIRITIFYQIN